MADEVKPKTVKERQRRVNFYEIVQQGSGNTNKRMKHVGWTGILRRLEKLPLNQRVVNGKTRTLVGVVLSVDGEPHLKLLRVRDESAWLEVYHKESDSVGDLDLGETGLLVETSIVAFLDYGNVIGLVAGSTTAPTPTAVAEWINGLGFLGSDIKVDTQAMVSHEATAKLKQSNEASRIETKVHTNRADALTRRGAKLGAVLKTINAEYGPMTVTVILQVSKARDQHEGRAMLREEAGKVLNAADASEVSRAKAKLMYIDADETTRLEEVDFIKQRITAKQAIPTTSDDGSPIRDTSAVKAILEVAQRFNAEIRKIVIPESS